MPILSNVDSVFRAQLRPLLGSFWSDVFQDAKQVNQLLSLVQKTSNWQGLQSMVQNMAGQTFEAPMVANVEIAFRDKDVVTTGMQLFDDPDNGLQFTDTTDPQFSFNIFRLDYFCLPVNGIIPLSIESVNGRLTSGVDFFVVRNQFIFFRQDPRLLFPKRIYSVATGRTIQPQLAVSFLAKMQMRENTDYVVNYLRNNQNPKAFELALAVAGELQILRDGQKLIAAVQTMWGMIYTFETQVIRVDYAHTPLVPGTLYPDDYIVGDGVRIVHSTTDGQGWWRSIDWQGGFILDPILNDFRGLSLRDALTTAYSSGSDVGSINGSKLHARLNLTNDFALEDAYWNYVAARETEMSSYLNNYLRFVEDAPGTVTFAELLAASQQANIFNLRYGFPPEQPDVASLPNSRTVNAMDVFFQAMLADTAYVIVLDSSQIKNPAKLYSFLAREMMVGGVPIVIDLGLNLAVDTLNIGDSISMTVTTVPLTDVTLVDVMAFGANTNQVFLKPLVPVVI